MYITLLFKNKTYALDSYNFSLDLPGGDDTKLESCVPGTITMQLHVPVEQNPGADFITFANDQHNTAKKEGSGVVTVFAGEDVGNELQKIEFSQAWITSLDLSSSEHDDQFGINLTFAAGSLTVSKVPFTHKKRALAVPKSESK